MDKIRCLFADDEPLMRERMRDLLALHSEHFEVVAEAINGADALEKFETTQPDVCFLDIRMPVKSGLEVASEIGDRAKIVFCTAYDQFAIEAFERGAVDYLLKPIEEDRLALTLERLLGDVDTPADVTPVVHLLNSKTPSTSERLNGLKRLAGCKMFPSKTIFSIRYEIHACRDGDRGRANPYFLRECSMDWIRNFLQVHRGSIVNASHRENHPRGC